VRAVLIEMLTNDNKEDEDIEDDDKEDDDKEDDDKEDDDKEDEYVHQLITQQRRRMKR
jgi:ABC-type Zn2+ transport system substrate-binding protein/surface adhesin